MAESNQRELDIHDDEFIEVDDFSAIPVSTASPPEIDSAAQDHGASAPPMQTDQSNPSGMSSPSLSEKPLLNLSIVPVNIRRVTPRSHTPNFFTPLGSPIRRAIQLTKFDPQDAWLPITESRNGNAYYAAFHSLCSGIGIPALVLPVSFTVLGWYRNLTTIFFIRIRLINEYNTVLFMSYSLYYYVICQVHL